MAATPDPAQELVDAMYNEDSVIKATRKIVSDSELVMKSLGTTADDINKYIRAGEYCTYGWRCVMLTGSVAITLVMYLLALDSLGSVLYVVIVLCMLLYTVFGIVAVPMMVDIWRHKKVKKMVKDRMTAPVKQLYDSIMELERAPSVKVRICQGSQMTILNYEQRGAVVEVAISMATSICLEFVSLRGEGYLTAGRVADRALPQLSQQLEGFKTSAKLLHVAAKEQYKLVASQN